MRVIVLGADGYLGWPTALHFSARGQRVAADPLIVRAATQLPAAGHAATLGDNDGHRQTGRGAGWHDDVPEKRTKAAVRHGQFSCTEMSFETPGSSIVTP